MDAEFPVDADFGVVVIGRNEGERLRRCLESISQYSENLVYVDSDSTDRSVDLALSMGIAVVELDVTIPFTAARARNEGFTGLCELYPKIAYVQFVDGDCEVVEGWLDKAVHYLNANDNVAVVCGRRRERYPDRTVYNMLCDIEWETPVGEARACGGDAMMRVDALKQVGGFKNDLIAGEEPELCVRLRQRDWRIWRLDAEMTLHDAAMNKFAQWWKRASRAGYAFGEGAYLHGKLPEKHWVRQVYSACFWGLVIPLGTMFLIYYFGLWALLLFLIYPLQVLRLMFRGDRTLTVNFQRAFFLVLGKFPEMLGVLKFLVNRFLNRRHGLIEYK
jgi:GT2 family glycosyltransferase